MVHDRIEQLLQEADKAVAARTSEPADLAQRVLKTSRRKRRRRTTAILVLMIGVLSAPLAWRGTERRNDIALRVDPSPRARLEEQIKAQEDLLFRMELSERMAGARAKLAALDEQPNADDLAERAASAMVFQADRLIRGPKLTDPAMQAYQQVISYFPQTSSAAVARQRVAEIGRKEG